MYSMELFCNLLQRNELYRASFDFSMHKNLFVSLNPELSALQEINVRQRHGYHRWRRSSLGIPLQRFFQAFKSLKDILPYVVNIFIGAIFLLN